MDTKSIRDQFSIFNNNKDLVYLDSSATSLTPDKVVKAMDKYYYEYNSNIGRSSNEFALIAQKEVDNARKKIANFFSVDENNIIFGPSTTISINNIARSLSNIMKPDKNIVVTDQEHHSNFLPWLKLSQEFDLELRIAKSNENIIEAKDVAKLVDENTVVISIHHMSNVIGNIIDFQEVAKNKQNAFLIIDGAQSAPHMKVDFNNIDAFIISGHKMYGPTGININYLSDEIQEELEPFNFGGGMVIPSSVNDNSFLVKKGIDKFEAGTLPIAEIIGLSLSIDFINDVGIENIEKHVLSLKEYFLNNYEKIKDLVTIYNKDIKNNLITFNINSINVHDAVSNSIINDISFSTFNIALREGQLCNNITVNNVLGQKAIIRASFGIYNTTEDVAKLINAIEKIASVEDIRS
ncbi:MAG: aminotransferase class V-fold PLP-dependent enzyme [Mycoplasmatales bacterium]